MSESQELPEWLKHYLGKFIHISYYFFRHLLFNDYIFYRRFSNIYEYEESDCLSFHLFGFYFISNSYFIKINIKISCCLVTLKKYDIKKLLKIFMTLKTITQSALKIKY